MGELKSFRIKEVEDGCPFWQAEYEVYSKSEADKLIAELNMRICDGDEDFEIANNQINRLLKIVRHQKYKRCDAMRHWCASRAVIFDNGNEKKSEWYWKWKEKWKTLAEQFKEAK